MPARKTQYRPDIDGLRAVAVLSVLLFHANFEFLSGGFVGVDIFFVISGYLITSIIVKELSDGTFTVMGFYERRFRRLLPALLVVILVTLFVGVLLLHPNDLLDLAQSVLATSFFSSNILFNLESGYFDGPAELKPLLHTWSLAVEEQFYVVFPIILILVARYSSEILKPFVVILFVLSFILCVLGTSIDATAAFYLLPTRAWELLAGGLIALGVFPVLTSRLAREFFALFGITCILTSLIFFTPDTAFPGYAAALPVAGTMLLLHSGSCGATIVASILCIRPVVFIGLISYSLYLWHWPILVYSDYITTSEPGKYLTLSAITLVFAISAISWRYVEKPFREKSLFANRKSMLSASGAATLVMIVISVLVIVMQGLPNRFSYASEDHLNDMHEWDRWGQCQTHMDVRLSMQRDLCSVGQGSATAKFLLWGDSHARSIASSLEASAIKQNVSGVIATKTACPPLMGIDRVDQTSCVEFNDKVLKYIRDSGNIETVILAARWNLAYTGERYKEEPGAFVSLTDILSNSVPEFGNPKYVELGLRRTIGHLIEMGKSVVVVHQIPEIGYDVQRINFLSKIFETDLDEKISPTFEEFQVRSAGINSLLKSLSNEYPINLIEPSVFLCNQDICHVTSDGITLYLDDDHLSISGARHISELFDSALGVLR